MSDSGLEFLHELQAIVDQRRAAHPDRSYTARLLASGPARIAQKVGEEGVEVAIAAATGDRDGLRSESADLLYHLIVLLRSQGLRLQDVVAELAKRHAGDGVRPR